MRRVVFAGLLGLTFLLAAGCDGYLGRSRVVRPDPIKVGQYGHEHTYLRDSSYYQE